MKSRCTFLLTILPSSIYNSEEVFFFIRTSHTIRPRKYQDNIVVVPQKHPFKLDARLLQLPQCHASPSLDIWYLLNCKSLAKHYTVHEKDRLYGHDVHFPAKIKTENTRIEK